MSELLDVDREYRNRAAPGTLQRIAPRRLNPSGECDLCYAVTEQEAVPAR